MVIIVVIVINGVNTNGAAAKVRDFDRSNYFILRIKLLC